MNRLALVSISALALLAIAGLGFSARQPTGVTQPAPATVAVPRNGETLLSATGDALVSRKPDRAVVMLGATVTETTSATAQNNLNKKMDAIANAIRAQQLPGVVLQTQWANLQPQYDYQRPEVPRIIGYIASSSLRVQLGDPAQAGKVIDAAISAGSNSIGGITFELADDKAARAEAIKAASEDARVKIDAMAAALGLRLTRVVEATTGAASVMPPHPYAISKMSLRAGGESTPTPVETGQIEVSAQVTVTFAAEPIK